MIASPPGMPPDLPRHDALVRQKSGEAALELIRRAAYRVARVAVVGAPAVEAEIAGRTDEERLEDVAVSHLVDLRGHVERPARHRHAAPEVQQTVQMEGRDLGVVSLVVREVEVVRQGLLLPGKP